MSKRLFIPLLITEIILLCLAGVAGVVIKRCNAKELQLSAVSEWSSEYIEPIDGIWTVTDGQLPDGSRADDDITAAIAIDEGLNGHYPSTVSTGLEDPSRFSLTLIESPKFDIPKGSYTLTVSYGASVDQLVTLRTYDRNDDILANPATLSKNLNVIEYHFTVKHDVEDVTIAIPYNHYGDLTIRSVSLLPNMNATKSALILALILFFLADLVVWDMAHNRLVVQHRTAVSGVLITLFLSSLPLILPGMVIGQDEYFHLMRIDGLAEAIRSGQFPVRMESLWMDGFGYPVSVYYGDLLLYIPAFFRLAGFSVNASYKIFILLINLAVIIVSYRCFGRMFKTQNATLTATAGYTLAVYRAVDVYVRSAIGEALAFIFYPLIALSLWRMYGYDEENKDADEIKREIITDAMLMSIGMSGIIYSHTLSVAMTAAFLLIIVLIFIKRTITKRVITTWIFSVIGSFLLSAAFLIPFADYTVSVTTNSKIDAGKELIQWGGAYLYQYLMLFQYPFGGNTADVADRLAYTPGLILMIGFIAAIVHIVLRHANRSTIYVFILSAISLWLASNVFPWDFITEHITGSVSTIQFPWRFVGIACICLATLFGCIIDTIDEHAVSRSMDSTTTRWIPIIFLMCAIIQGSVFFGQYAVNDYRTSFRDTAELDPYAVTSFFLREGIADDEPLNMSYPTSSGIDRYEVSGRNGTTLSAYVSATAGSYMEFPVFYYPYYRLYDANGRELPISDGSHHLIRAEFSDAYDGNITLCYKEPMMWRISELISLAAIIGCVALSQRAKRGKIS